MMKRIVSVICVLVLSLSLCGEVSAETRLVSKNNKYGKFTYSVYHSRVGCIAREYIELKSYKGKASHLKIPCEMGKRQVESPPSRYKYPKKIKEITLEKRIFYPNKGEFTGLPNLKEFHIKNSTNGAYAKKGVLFADIMGGLWAYAYPRGKKAKSYKVPKKVAVIGDYAFANCKNLKSITLPKNLIEIKDYAFYGCKSLKKITIPKRVYYIGEGAFKKCKAKVVLPHYMEKVKGDSKEGSHYELFVDGRPKDDPNAAIEHVKYRDIEEIQPDTKTVEMTVNSKHTLVTHFQIEDHWNTLLSDGLAYKSSNPKVATVDDHGVVTAKKRGTTKITVRHLYLYGYHNYAAGIYTVKITIK
ncbi:MAG: leucine-rich repeat protein [Lachnospiraceae bacterium]|nr:leucine-rich repeat protein [Lachnospiraceae bacterium]